MRKFDCNFFRITGNTNFKKKLTSFVSKSAWGNPAMKVKVATDYLFIFLNIILHLLTKHILQLQNLKLKESIYRYYKLDQNYIKTRKKSTAVVIISTITIDLLINRLFR